MRIVLKSQPTVRHLESATKHVVQQALAHLETHVHQWLAANDFVIRCFRIRHVEKKETLVHHDPFLFHHPTKSPIDDRDRKEYKRIMKLHIGKSRYAIPTSRYYIFAITLFVLLMASPLFQTDQYAHSTFMSMFGKTSRPRSARAVLIVPGMARKIFGSYTWDLYASLAAPSPLDDNTYIDFSIMQLHPFVHGYYVPTIQEQAVIIRHSTCLSSDDISSILRAAKDAIEENITDPRYRKLATKLALPGHSTTTVLWSGVMANAASLACICVCLWCLIPKKDHI